MASSSPPLLPYSSTCTCNCPGGYWVWGTGVNSTSISEVTDSDESEEDGVTTTESNILTVTTVVNDAVTETHTNETVVVKVTSATGVVTTTVTVNVTVNVTGDASGRARAWGVCTPPVVCEDCLQCHNCLYIPSMSNFTVCVADNTVRKNTYNIKLTPRSPHILQPELYLQL